MCPGENICAGRVDEALLGSHILVYTENKIWSSPPTPAQRGFRNGFLPFTLLRECENGMGSNRKTEFFLSRNSQTVV